MPYIEFHHGDVHPGSNASGIGMYSMPRTQALSAPNQAACGVQSDLARALVHVVDVDHVTRGLLAGWLDTAGIESVSYATLGALLSAERNERPGCLVIDAQVAAINELGTLTEAALSIRRPIVVIARQAGVTTAVRAMKAGAVDFVEKPLRQQEILAAIRCAVDVDRGQRAAASRRAQLHARFATLTRRQRQVMALVTAGKLNKQVGCALGLCEITIKAHRSAVMRKMGAHSLADLVRIAVALGESVAV